MQTKYVVRQLVRNEYANAAGLRFAVYELLSDSAQTVALFYDEAQARRVCNALQYFCEKGTKPLGATPMLISPMGEAKPQSSS
jgi:hypothetical protein